MPVMSCVRRRWVFVVASGVALIAVLAAGMIDLALAQGAPFGVARPPAGAAPPAADGIVGWLLAKQAEFYRGLSVMIRSAKTDGGALWGLFGLSFAYGVFHAAGPGHGKAVISSYVVANEETWRRGVVLSFASALLQALTAVLIVGVAAVLLGATAKVMGDTVRWIETFSYALIALMGARLTWVKGQGFLDTLRNGNHSGHAHHDHDHGHHHDHAHHDHDGHAHGPEPRELAGPGGWRRGLTAIVAVGLRPCSGAILVLVFALAQGLFWAGVVATFIMGLGTAITVAVIATLAVWAKELARRLAARKAGPGSLLLRGVEVGASLLVLAFGLALLAGYMANERLFAV
jgi:nickel/cobalt exporter